VKILWVKRHQRQEAIESNLICHRLYIGGFQVKLRAGRFH